MKSNYLKIILACLTSIILIYHVSAQDKRVTSIDAKGNVFDSNGNHIGRITTDGIITNQEGTKVATISEEGCLEDTSTTRTDNFESFKKINSQITDQKWTITETVNGVCKIKDNKENTLVEVHKSFVKFGVCTYNCLVPKKLDK